MNLDLEGSFVVRVCFDGAVTLLTSSNYEIRIETRTTIEVFGEGAVVFEPEEPGRDATSLVSLVREEISLAEATDGGVLKIRFGDRAELTTAPHESYEAWSAIGPSGQRFICMPGGELATWREADE